MLLSGFWPLKISQGQWIYSRNFGDLQMLLRMISCAPKWRSSIYQLDLPNGCGGYTYGYYFARALGALGVNDTLSGFFGFSFLLFVLLSLGLLANFLLRNSNLSVSLVFLACISPGVWLAIIHGSLDILIFLLVCLAFFLYKSGKDYSALFLISIATLAKFFTLPLLIILTYKTFIHAKNNFVRLFILLSSLAISLSTLSDIQRVPWNDSRYRLANGIFNVFGIDTLNNWVKVISSKYFHRELLFSPAIGKILSGLIFLILLLVTAVILFRRGNLLNQGNRPGKSIPSNYSRMGFIFFSLPFLTLYFQGANWDNKLLFAIPSGLFLLAFTPESKAKQFLTWNFFLGLWFSCFWPKSFPQISFVLIQMLGDLSISLFAAALVAVLIRHVVDTATNVRLTKPKST